MQIQVYETKPEDFQPAVEVSGCLVEVRGRLLVLERGPAKEESGKWGVPAGKLEKGEDRKQGAQRELLEETGIFVELSSLQSIGVLYIRKPPIDYVYHSFRVVLEKEPEVRLSEEHLRYRWVRIKELGQLSLVEGSVDVLRQYQKAIF